MARLGVVGYDLVLRPLSMLLPGHREHRCESSHSSDNVSHGVRVLVTPWTVACRTPPSMGFSRQGYWSRVPLPSPGDLPNSGIELGLPALQADSLLSEPPRKPVKVQPPITLRCNSSAVTTISGHSRTRTEVQLRSQHLGTSLRSSG